MNESICRLCLRYGGQGAMSKGWLCAKTIYTLPSAVLPGFSHFERTDFHPITEQRKQPPDWCERPLEQVILVPDAVPDIARRENPNLVFDGNNVGQMHLRDRN